MSFLIIGSICIAFCMPAQNGSFLAAGTEPGPITDSLSSDPFPWPKDMSANDPSLALLESYYKDLCKLKIELTLEGFKVEPLWVDINAAFSIVYQFDIGEDSRPIHILLLAGERHIDPKAAAACLAKWSFSGLLPKKKYILILNWEHIKGYTSMSILGDEMSLSVRLQKDRPVP